jgi:hypothetical protein
MAESKKKSDPTVTSMTESPAYPEGTHPPRPESETFHSPDRFVYKDNPDKPDPSSVAQIVEDPNA